MAGLNNIKGMDNIVDINLVHPNTWNPKESIEESTENKEKFEEIKEEIRKKGLFEAITVRETDNGYEILDGYHRWLACNQLGFTKIRINSLGIISDGLAKAITLIKEQKKVPISELKVAEVVGEYAKSSNNLEEVAELFGYSIEKLDEYIKMFDFNWDDYNAKQAEQEDKPKTIVCPKCGEIITL